jgi:hypothetical protein
VVVLRSAMRCERRDPDVGARADVVVLAGFKRVEAKEEIWV